MYKKKLQNTNLELRLVDEKDAKFILELRQNSELNRYISKTSVAIEDQIKWIKDYQERNRLEMEFYFIVYNKIKNEKCGTIRIYNIKHEEGTCEWGSFMLAKGRPNGACYDVIDLTLKFIKSNLKLNRVNLEVHKDNLKAKYIYLKKGFIFYKSDDLNEHYKIEL